MKRFIWIFSFISLSLTSCISEDDAIQTAIAKTRTARAAVATTHPTETPTRYPTITPTTELIAAPTRTDTPKPTLTQPGVDLPGVETIPINKLAREIPWLPIDLRVLPGTEFIAFNSESHPFNNNVVRQAFSYAVDREAIARLVREYDSGVVQPATVFTPPQVLGRDLFGDVGINFDPLKAKAYLAEAGYADPATFPHVEYWVNYALQDEPGRHLFIANAVTDMWDEHLGISVEVIVVADWGEYLNRIQTDPPDIFRMGWLADYIDPDNFLRELFHSGSGGNVYGFSNLAFDRLVKDAQYLSDPEERQILYIEAESILCGEQAAVIPLFFQTMDVR